ncbi:MAG: hypothetical protein WAL25_11995 [Acidimicrobiia bacterium]
MSLRAEALLLAAVVAIAACGDGGGEPVSSDPLQDGADSPVEAVNELVSAINEPDFAGASHLAMPGQAALASLAEGSTFDEVAAALRQGDQEIAANFWAGFAQGTGSFLTGDVGVVDDGTTTLSDQEFHVVKVTPETGGVRSVVVQESDGYRIDLFASFGAGLADQMTGTVERLIATQTDDARLILDELRGIVPSLLAAAQLPGTSGQVSQELLALVEVITRVG